VVVWVNYHGGNPMTAPLTLKAKKTSAGKDRFKKARTEARATRRLASRTAAVSIWWTRLATPRPEFMTPKTLAVSLGYPIRRMAAALRWLGWRKIIRRIHGQQVPLWLPPTSTIKPRPKGRPRIYQS
jgi:hypothetical protein